MRDKMGFSRMSQWMVLALMPIYLVTGCGDLEPEMQDTRTVILKMDFDQRSSSRTSSFSHVDLSNYKTHLIMVLTSEIMVLTSGKNLSNSNYWDYRSNQGEYVLYDSDREITLNMKLDTKMKIFAFLFRENYSIGGDPDYDLFSANRDAGYYGESQIITIDDRQSIPANIILNQVSGTDTAGGTDTGGGTDTTVTFSPANGATGVAISDNIIITFSEAVRNIDNTVLTDSNIDSLITLKLTNASGANITFDATIDANMKVITINPISNLPNSQAVYVAIGATVEDSADHVITAANATFTTGGSGDYGGTDTTAPTVTFSPVNGATGVAISDNIIITFSEAVRNIDNTVLTDSNIDSLITLKLTNASGADITFDATIDANMKVITINPISNLFYSQAVYVAIGATVEDSADHVITAANATFTTTMDPLLEAFYPFNGNANDESENSYHGQLGNNVNTSTFPTLTKDRYGNADKAFLFDGDDYIALDKYVTPNSISEITVCAWVLPTDTTNKKFIISFDRSESYRLALKDGGNTYVGWNTTDSNGKTDDLRTLVSYEDEKWHHVCGWYKKSSTAVDKKIFVDADMVKSHSSNTHSGRNLGNSVRYGYIGWGSEASSFDGNGNIHQDDFMKGKIDDVRIYSRSLSDEEISALYFSEKP